MNNRKQKNKRGKNPRQYVLQKIEANPKKKKKERNVVHLTKDQ